MDTDTIEPVGLDLNAPQRITPLRVVRRIRTVHCFDVETLPVTGVPRAERTFFSLADAVAYCEQYRKSELFRRAEEMEGRLQQDDEVVWALY